MRIRSTKPEFWRSSTIGQLDWDTRLVLKALESYVDDNGVGRDQLVIFCADAFPHDLAQSPEVCAKVSGALSRLDEAGLIVRYTVNGEALIYVRNWRRWQYIDKPKAGRYPRPDGSMNYHDDVDETIGAGQYVFEVPDPSKIRAASRKPRENRAKSSGNYPQIQSGEQGNRGTGEQGGEQPVELSTALATAAPYDPPPEFCSKHPGGTDKPCRACGTARKTREAWDDTHAATLRDAEATRRQRAKERAENCPICKGTNWIPDTEPAVRCAHNLPEGTAA
jgi:hypothetical protein